MHIHCVQRGNRQTHFALVGLTIQSGREIDRKTGSRFRFNPLHARIE